MEGLGHTRNRCKHDKRTGIELQGLTHCARRWLGGKVSLEDFVELLDRSDVEQIEMHEHDVFIAAAGFVKQCSEVS